MTKNTWSAAFYVTALVTLTCGAVLALTHTSQLPWALMLLTVTVATTHSTRNTIKCRNAAKRAISDDTPVTHDGPGRCIETAYQHAAPERERAVVVWVDDPAMWMAAATTSCGRDLLYISDDFIDLADTSPVQATAIITHELGHLVAGHASFHRTRLFVNHITNAATLLAAVATVIQGRFFTTAAIIAGWFLFGRLVALIECATEVSADLFAAKTGFGHHMAATMHAAHAADAGLRWAWVKLTHPPAWVRHRLLTRKTVLAN